MEYSREHFIQKQIIELKDPFKDDDKIIDLGGGGEGIIGILRQQQVTAIDNRKQELDETPTGPIKVVADARNLPFQDEKFTAASAFFFLMYLDSKDRLQVLKEAYRVLKKGSYFYIWDVIIPDENPENSEVFIIPLEIKLPDKTINTGYGTRWNGRSMSCDEICELSENAGFTILESNHNKYTFFIKMMK